MLFFSQNVDMSFKTTQQNVCIYTHIYVVYALALASIAYIYFIGYNIHEFSMLYITPHGRANFFFNQGSGKY